MKKSLYICIALLALTINALMAQTTPSKRFTFGVWGGVNYSFPMYRIRFPSHIDPSWGAIYGIETGYSFSARNSIRIQAAIETQKVDKIWTDSGTLIYFKGTTLKLPVLYRYYILPNRKFLFLEAGLAFNHLINNSYQSNYTLCGIASCSVLYNNGNIKAQSALSALGGIGVNINAQKINIPVTLRYENYITGYSFSDAFDAQQGRVLKFENVSLTAGVNF